MIDINNIEKLFKNYVANYDPQNPRIKLKIEHIERVAKNSELISKSLGLSQEECNLAIAIGFFHDLGRFEQVRIANTFSDKESKINHGEMSVKVLKENNFIRKFIETSEYDEIIYKAILNHNKAKIEDGLTDKELLFAKIIRDADKLDIFYLISKEEYSMESIFWYNTWDQEKIDEEIMLELFNEDTISYSKIKNNADVISIFYGYIYDLYFPATLEIISKEKYLNIFTDRVCQKFPSPKIHEQVKSLLNFCNKYLAEHTI